MKYKNHYYFVGIVILLFSHSLFASIACPDNSAHFCNICVDGSVIINGTGTSDSCTGAGNALAVAGDVGIGGDLNICGLTTMGGGRALSRSIPCTGSNLRLEVLGDVGISDDLYVCGTIIANGFSGVTGTFNPALPVIFSNTGNASGCTGGSPAVTVLGGEVIYGNLGVGGSIQSCGFITGTNINTNVLSSSANCNLSIGDNTNNVNNGLTGVTALGEGALRNNGGSYNTAVGCNALNQNTSATGNVGIGYQALQNNVTGQRNVAIGELALQNVPYSVVNVAIGDLAMQNAAGSSINVGIGASAMQNAVGCGNNVAIGILALGNVTGSNENVAIGHSAMTNATGNGNVGIGLQTMQFLQGTDNIALGPLTMLRSKAGNCIGIGISAMENGSNCTDDIAIGRNAMLNVTGTSFNIAIGVQALQNASGATVNIAIGQNAMQNASGVTNIAIGQSAMRNATGTSNVVLGTVAMQMNNGDNNVAMGNASMGNAVGSSLNIAIGSNAMLRSTGAAYNVAIGFSALRVGTGANNVAIGTNALTNSVSGINNIAIGNSAGSALNAGGSNDIYIGHAGVAGESNAIRVGTSQTTAYIAGIFSATTGAGYAPVYVNSSNQLAAAASSRNYKKDIESLDSQSEKMLKLRPVSFIYKHDSQNNKQFGLIAEEVNEIYPELIVRDEAGGIFTINYIELIPLLLKQIQELELHNSEQLQEQKDRNKEYETQDAVHEAKISDLYALMNKLLAKIDNLEART